MRRIGSLLMAAVVGGSILASPVTAAPTPGSGAAPSVPAVVKGTPVCKITDKRLQEISGLVSIGNGFAAVNDGSDSGGPQQLRVFFLDAQCKVTSVYVDNQQPRDPEDLALAPDGTLWVADIGDNNSTGPDRRLTVALWKIPPGEGSKRGRAQIFRMTYPDGAHDGEALLLNGDGTPIIITKGGESGIYTPASPLTPGVEVPLKKVGTFTPSRTGTPSGFLGVVGQGLVTGGANSPDGKKVALRTYSDAYEWDVPDGDVIAALKGTPRITPLPDEPQGESITYSADGSLFFTVSETARLPAGNDPEILKYVPTPPGQPGPPAEPASERSSFIDSLTITDIGLMIAGVGVLGLLLVIAGVIGIKKARRRFDEEEQVPQRSIGSAKVPDTTWPDDQWPPTSYRGHHEEGPSGHGMHSDGWPRFAPEPPKNSRGNLPRDGGHSPGAQLRTGAVYGRPLTPADDATSPLPRVNPMSEESPARGSAGLRRDRYAREPQWPASSGWPGPGRNARPVQPGIWRGGRPEDAASGYEVSPEPGYDFRDLRGRDDDPDWGARR